MERTEASQRSNHSPSAPQRAISWVMDAQRYPSFRNASIILLIETFVWHQSLLTIGMLFYGTLILVGSGLQKLFKQGEVKLTRALIYIIFGFVALGLARVGSSYYSPWAFEQVISACKEYKQDHGSYPQELDALTPDYMPVIPPAKLSVIWFSYIYINQEPDEALLGYVIFPPFYRKFYIFHEDRYNTLD